MFENRASQDLEGAGARLVSEPERLGLAVLEKAVELLNKRHAEVFGDRRATEHTFAPHYEYRILLPRQFLGKELVTPGSDINKGRIVIRRSGAVSYLDEMLHPEAADVPGKMITTIMFRVPLDSTDLQQMIFELSYLGNAIPRFFFTFSHIPERYAADNPLSHFREATKKDLQEFLYLLHQPRTTSI